MKVYVVTYSVDYETCDTFVGVFNTAVDAINFLKVNPERVTGDDMAIYEIGMGGEDFGIKDRIVSLFQRDYREWVIVYEDGSKESLGETVWDNEKGETVWSR